MTHLRAPIATFTHNDHLKYGKGAGSIGPCSYLPRLPLREAIRAARLIYEKSPHRLTLCLSGGVDSEAMAVAFTQAKIPFTAAILRFKDDWNDFDTNDAVTVCQRLNIKFRWIDLDVIEFYESGVYLDYLKAYNFGYAELASHLWLMEQIDEVPVFSGNPLLAERVGTDTQLLLPANDFMCYHRFLATNQRLGVGHFFLYTAELAMSFVRLPRFQHFLYSPDKGHDGPYSYEFKVKLYNDGGFPVSARENKYTGFEKLISYYATHLNIDWDKKFRVASRDQEAS